MIVLLAVGALVIYLFSESPESTTSIQTQSGDVGGGAIAVERPPLPTLPAPPDSVVEDYQLAGDLPVLSGSDSYLRGHLMFLAGELLLNTLQGDQFVRRLVTQVNNIANGKMAHQHSPIRLPNDDQMEIVETDSGYILDATSYERYSDYANLLENIDTQLLLAFYGFYEPLFEEANVELGNPEESFRGTFVVALDEILSAPVIDGDIALHQPNVNWMFVDPELEQLNAVHKQLIRMGPENTLKIQSALQDIRDVLAAQLPDAEPLIIE